MLYKEQARPVGVVGIIIESQQLLYKLNTHTSCLKRYNKRQSDERSERGRSK